MTRRAFGGTGADQVIDTQGNVIANAVGTAWTAQTGGLQITDLQTYGGSAITQIVADASGLPEWLGPDDGTAKMWVDFGIGRRLARAVDTEDRVAALETAAATALHTADIGVDGGIPGPLDSSQVLPAAQVPVGAGGFAPLDSSGLVQDSDIPSWFPAVAQYDGAAYPTRGTITSDATRMVIWKGPTDPTFGANYAKASVDVWFQET